MTKTGERLERMNRPAADLAAAIDGQPDDVLSRRPAEGAWLAKEVVCHLRHDSVAHDLVHRALVVVDRLYHPLQNRVEDPARLLGVAVGALEVGEESGDLLAFTLGLSGR